MVRSASLRSAVCSNTGESVLDEIFQRAGKFRVEAGATERSGCEPLYGAAFGLTADGVRLETKLVEVTRWDH
jgi:hypothetical protein